MRKIFSLFVALTAVISLSAKTLYLQPNEDWKKDGARFAICILSEPQAWVDMKAVEGEEGIYSAEVETESQIIFCRMKGDAPENKWDNKWNQTADLDIPEDKDLCVITGWDASSSWAKYGEEPAPEPTKYFLKHNFEGGDAWSWKEMTMQDEDTYILEDIVIRGEFFNVNTAASDEGRRDVKLENIIGYLPDYTEVELGVLDTVVFMLTPSEYAAMDPAKPGLFAVNVRKYVAPVELDKYFLKHNFDGENWEWKEMTMLDEDTYILENIVIRGEFFNLNTAASDEGKRDIKLENIKGYLPDYTEVELGVLDTVVFMYTPSAYASMDPAQPGLSAIEVRKYVAPQPVLPYVALIGEMNNWDGAANPFEVAEDKLTASVTVSLEQNDNEGYAFKILVDKIGLSARGEEWYHINREVTSAVLDWAEENSDPLWLEVDQAGNYTFIWTYATKTLEVIFPDPTAVENAEVGEKASKIMINGQLFIIKGNKTYNGLGQVVK